MGCKTISSPTVYCIVPVSPPEQLVNTSNRINQSKKKSTRSSCDPRESHFSPSTCVWWVEKTWFDKCNFRRGAKRSYSINTTLIFLLFCLIRLAAAHEGARRAHELKSKKLISSFGANWRKKSRKLRILMSTKNIPRNVENDDGQDVEVAGKNATIIRVSHGWKHARSEWIVCLQDKETNHTWWQRKKKSQNLRNFRISHARQWHVHLFAQCFAES